MKAEIIFLTAVLGIAAIHLLTNVVNYLSRFKRTQIKENREPKMRSDWHMFFDKTDLYGNINNIPVESKAAKEIPVDCEPTADDCLPQEAYA